MVTIGWHTLKEWLPAEDKPPAFLGVFLSTQRVTHNEALIVSSSGNTINLNRKFTSQNIFPTLPFWFSTNYTTLTYSRGSQETGLYYNNMFQKEPSGKWLGTYT